MEKEKARVVKLPDSVINRIAAGEVIQRPANVIKELIENSLDAGSTQITVTVKLAGWKFFQVQIEDTNNLRQIKFVTILYAAFRNCYRFREGSIYNGGGHDNGSGICKDDLKIICERFTTSKLRAFEDLQSIATYGFRGEALASISHVAHLTIVTKTADSICAYRAEYDAGVMKSEPKACAGNRGTQLTIEDLFYNMPIRRKALKSSMEEMKKIIDIIGKYAVHNAGVGFLLKRQGDSTVDVRSTGNSANEKPNVATVDSISCIYGTGLGRELMPIHCDARNDLSFEVSGFITGVHFSAKKYTFILFINHRLVECTALKRAVELVYTSYVPKGFFPFVYLSLEILPEYVDVNVHPTKQEVHFLNETAIVETIANTINRQLSSCNQSKSFVTKTIVDIDEMEKRSKPEAKTAPIARQPSSSTPVHQIVRTDGRERRLDEFFETDALASTSSFRSQSIRVNYVDFTGNNDDKTPSESSSTSVKPNEPVVPAEERPSQNVQPMILYESERKKATWRDIQLVSVFTMQKEIRERSSDELRQLIANHSLVGCIDPQYALIQYKTGLYLVNTSVLSEELFYQIQAFRFGNFAACKLSEKCPLDDLLLLAMRNNPMSSEERRELVKKHCRLLMSKAEMLWDYFSLQLQDGYLVSLPWLLEKYAPQIEGLSNYMYRLATEVDWKSEKGCFETFCRETAKFYTLNKKFCKSDRASSLFDASELSWRLMTETILYPEFKTRLCPPESFKSRNVIRKLTDVHDLYKVFERC